MKNKYSDEVYKINFLTSEMDALYHQAALKFGITDSALIILYTVNCMGDGCRLSDVYQFSGKSKQTINSAVRSLEAEDILHLEKNTGRTKRIVMTDKGKALVERTAARLHAAETGAFASWQTEEIAEHIRLTEKYKDCFRRQIEKL